MFTQLKSGATDRQARWLAISLTAHAFVFVWLLYSAAPKFIAPMSVRAGETWGAVTQLYWPADVSPGTAGDAQASATIPDEQPKKRLRWERRHKPLKHHDQQTRDARSGPETPTTASTATGGATPAGMPYGSLGSGSISGDEIRPALPVAAVDPVIDPADLPSAEGSVIVEVTIDDKGNIVQKTVIESLTPAIDAKVLAALENWRFLPATRNGVAIPSKQDVYYHFRPRG